MKKCLVFVLLIVYSCQKNTENCIFVELLSIRKNEKLMVQINDESPISYYATSSFERGADFSTQREIIECYEPTDSVIKIHIVLSNQHIINSPTPIREIIDTSFYMDVKRYNSCLIDTGWGQGLNIFFDSPIDSLKFRTE